MTPAPCETAQCTASGLSPAAEYISRNIFAKKGQRAGEFVPLLKRYAKEGRSLKGLVFTEEDVNIGFKLFEAMQVPTPVRNDSSASIAPARKPSSGELLTHAASSECLGCPDVSSDSLPGHLGGTQARATSSTAPASAPEPPKEKLNLRLLGTQSMNVRADPPRLQRLKPPPEDGKDEVTEPEAKRRKGGASPERAEPQTYEFGPLAVPILPEDAAVPHQLLRISAGRMAAVAGLHPFCDIGELFMELVYQDLPDLLLRDAAAVGAQVVSPAEERAQLLSKSGQSVALEAALKVASSANWLEGARDAQTSMAAMIESSRKSGRLTDAEAEELRRVLDLEVNLDFGERHEDAAIEAYEASNHCAVYGQQYRISVPLPAAGAPAALGTVFPPLRQEPLSQSEEFKAKLDPKPAQEDDKETTANKHKDHPDAYFLLTGHVDGLSDIAVANGASGVRRTVVVEVKHRMNKIKDPPNIYDICQLGSYCRALGLSEGHLVQCLREESPSNFGTGISTAQVGRLAVSRIDFSEGSPDRQGWDKHVLPGAYKMAEAVYAVRADAASRQALLKASSPEQRNAFVAELCPHLGR
mmetsp:Transcript_10417/g.23590  ORF Transcript_10417/g.23590 Transcript_10417/m.23590 type:complete len:584 (+) Transcript_10417:38-1789(+)